MINYEFQKLMEIGEQIIEEKKSADKLEKRVKNYSLDELLSMGRELVSDSRYLEAKVVFNEISKTKEMEVGYLSEIYGLLILSFVYLNSVKKVNSNPIINNMIYCMSETTRMHSEKSIPKEDLFTIETLIDRIASKDITIPDRDEFEKIYCRFKEYVTKVFVGEK